ncbi:putative signal peptide-containing protein [Cryptosporidium canis]|nr:putative signal peptide-containing protein [Cryptosporidium canis]
MSKTSSTSRKTTFKIFILQLLWISFFIILILGGLYDLILHYDIKRMVLNVLIILSGLMCLISEAYCFKFYSYMLFIYTPIGRGLFMIILSCLNLNDNLYSIIISAILFLNSIIYFLISAIFGGINKPLFNNSLKHELNLSAKVFFINDHSNITKYSSKSAHHRHNNIAHYESTSSSNPLKGNHHRHNDEYHHYKNKSIHHHTNQDQKDIIHLQ